MPGSLGLHTLASANFGAWQKPCLMDKHPSPPDLSLLGPHAPATPLLSHVRAHLPPPPSQPHTHDPCAHTQTPHTCMLPAAPPLPTHAILPGTAPAYTVTRHTHKAPRTGSHTDAHVHPSGVPGRWRQRGLPVWPARARGGLHGAHLLTVAAPGRGGTQETHWATAAGLTAGRPQTGSARSPE